LFWLQMRFPAASTLWMDASQIRAHSVFKQQEIGATISGLPLLTMPPWD
jgi:phospholipid N-methyltransferase